MKSPKRARNPPADIGRHDSRNAHRKTTRPAPPLRRTRDGAAVLVVGASGSGKTAWTLRQIPAGAPVLVWDCTTEWGGRLNLIVCRSAQHLAELIIADMRGELTYPFRVGCSWPVTAEHFEAFCKLAWVWIRSRRGNHLVIEELADVTSPAKAPAAWGEICRKNRYRGGRVFALTQRPAESDKTILGNCAVIHCGRMNTARDRRYMAECLDVPLEDVTGLQDLEYIERDMRTHAVRRGVVQFTRQT